MFFPGLIIMVDRYCQMIHLRGSFLWKLRNVKQALQQLSNGKWLSRAPIFFSDVLAQQTTNCGPQLNYFPPYFSFESSLGPKLKYFQDNKNRRAIWVWYSISILNTNFVRNLLTSAQCSIMNSKFYLAKECKFDTHRVPFFVGNSHLKISVKNCGISSR